MGRAAEKGILYRNAECMEQLQNIDSIVIDKTGTLTTGTPQVVEIFQVLDNAIAMSIFKSIEQKSEHPLAKSIVSYLHEIPTVKIQNYQTYAGKGISGTFSEGKYFIGSIAFIKDNGILLSQSIEEKLTIWEQKAYSVIILSDDKQILAIAALQDSIRENVSSVIKYLEDKRINLSILSGDSDAAVASIAAQVGISVYHSRMLPQDKATFIAGLQQKGHKVLMVGDGINDSPALAQADVSIAMGSGTDIAMEVADITLLHGDLQKIPVAIELSENIYKVINQNLIWAFLYNIISIPIAAGILYPTFGYLLHPMLAAAAMSVSSVSVVTNSLRLRKM
jgi:Cu2+-exporting ATPase